MNRSLFLVLTVCVASSFAASTGRSRQSGEPQSILKCTDGKLTGAQDFIDVFRTIMKSCQDQGSSENFYRCFSENLGITEEDGTPNMGKIQEFYNTIFSSMILQDLPDFQDDLNQCGNRYVLDHNGYDLESTSSSAENFLRCFTESAQNFSQLIEKVCKLEEDINGEYFRQKQQKPEPEAVE